MLKKKFLKHQWYYETIYKNEENYKEKILCYELHLGLEEIYENAIDEDLETLEWLQNRCKEILK